MNQTQLKGDLNAIEQAVDRGDIPEAVKRVLRDLLEWNRGLVEQAGGTVERVDAIEDAVDELLQGAEEGISMETAKVLMTALEQSRILATTLIGALEKSPFDDLTTERFQKLAKTCLQSVMIAMQATQELVMPEEEDPDEVTTVPNGPATADEASEDAGDEGDEDEGDEDEGDEEVDNG